MTNSNMDSPGVVAGLQCIFVIRESCEANRVIERCSE